MKEGVNGENSAANNLVNTGCPPSGRCLVTLSIWGKIMRIWWSYIPHFLSTPGYVYSYAFGELLVLALYGIYQKEGDTFVGNYLELLAKGGSASPYDMLESFRHRSRQPGLLANRSYSD